MKHRFRRWRIVLRKVLRRVVFSRSSANAVAWGVALGVFIGLTPTVGFQMILAALLATLFRVNRLAAVIPVWISNPFTVAPILYLDFRVGATLLPVEKAGRAREQFAVVAERISEISITDLFGTMGAVLGEMGRLGAGVLVPLFVGSAIVGAAGAAVAYPLALWGVEFVRRRRRGFSIRRAERRLERLEHEGLYFKTDTGSWQPIRDSDERTRAEPRAEPEEEKAEKAKEAQDAREARGADDARRKPLGPIVPRADRDASPGDSAGGSGGGDDAGAAPDVGLSNDGTRPGG